MRVEGQNLTAGVARARAEMLILGIDDTTELAFHFVQRVEGCNFGLVILAGDTVENFPYPLKKKGAFSTKVTLGNPSPRSVIRNTGFARRACSASSSTTN